MYCSISGVAPREPVLSKTGFIFERRLIEEHLQQTGQCPVTNQPLTENDLTDIKGEPACAVARHSRDAKIQRRRARSEEAVLGSEVLHTRRGMLRAGAQSRSLTFSPSQ
jgi:hypothetical protein